MAISLIADGGWATGTTSLSVPYPAGIQAGDLLVLAIANKYPANSPTAPTDWVIPANGQQSGGSGSNGIDTGNVYATIMVKIATGSESGSLTVNIASGDSAVANMVLYRKAADKSWEYVCTNGSDNSAGTSWSVTGAANPGITAGDRMFTCSGINTDSYMFSSHALAASGVTFGAVLADGSGTNLGQDCFCTLTDHVVSSGTASAAPTFTMSASGTTTNNPAGATVIMRMREVTGGHTITAESGSYSLTGQVAAVVTARKVVSNAGSYTLTGNAAVLKFGYKVTAGAGAYALTGNSVNLVTTRAIAAVSGTYALNGNSANLLFNRKLTSDFGQYAITGQSANLVYTQSNILAAETGAFVIAGQSATLTIDRNLIAESGVYNLTGTETGLTAGKVIIASNGTYLLTGTDAGIIVNRVVQAAAGVYSITGSAASLIYSADGTPVIIINLSSEISSTINASSQINNNFTGTSLISNFLNL